MTEGKDAKVTAPVASDEELDPRLSDPWTQAWLREHLPELEREWTGQRLLYTYLAVAVVVGLVAHVAGYTLRSMAPAEPLGLVADLLYALGYALWTGAVVVVFVQVLPEAKRRQIKQALDAYRAAQDDRAGTRAP